MRAILLFIRFNDFCESHKVSGGLQAMAMFSALRMNTIRPKHKSPFFSSAPNSENVMS